VAGVDDIMSIPDISAEESHDLPRILNSVADEATSSFCGAGGGHLGGAVAALDPLLLSRALEEACTPLLKLKVFSPPPPCPLSGYCSVATPSRVLLPELFGGRTCLRSGYTYLSVLQCSISG